MSHDFNKYQLAYIYSILAPVVHVSQDLWRLIRLNFIRNKQKPTWVAQPRKVLSDVSLSLRVYISCRHIGIDQC